MKFRPKTINILLNAVVLMVVLACQAGSIPALVTTPVPSATSQPEPTDTPTIKVENTPNPTTAVTTTQSETPTSLLKPTPVMTAPRNVVLVVVDSLRADHLSSYGYSRQTTPNLDRWMAQEGTRFVNAVPSASWTCPSNAAIMSGYSPTILNATFQTSNASLKDKFTTLAEYLNDAGFFSAGFVTNPCLAARYGFGQGFDYYDDSFLSRKDISTSNKVRANEVNDAVMEWVNNYWVNEKGEKPRLFMFLYYMEPHVWHYPPAPFTTLFDPDYNGSMTPEIFGTGQPAIEGKLAVSERDKQHQIGLYDGEIASWDAQFAQLTAYFDQIGLSDDTLFILTGDHGEFLGEYGLWAHAQGLEQEVLQVPFIFKYKGAIPAGTVVSDTVQTMDLMPTILDWVGVPLRDEIQAQSIRTLAQGMVAGQTTEPGRPAFSEINAVTDTNYWAYWQAPRENLYSVYQDGWRYIYHSEHLAKDELYQLASSSPYQTENLLDNEPARSEAMKSLILAYFNLQP